MILPLLVFAQLGLVQFETRVLPETVYVGQQVAYDATTLVDDLARQRLRANPEFTPSDVTGVTIYDFPFDTASISDVNQGGIHFRRYVYHRALFPLNSGTFTIPPGTLRYSLPDGDDYYSPMRAFTERSQSSTFVAIPLPAAGKPIGFSGAVGEFRDTIRTDGSAPRVGDPFVVTMRLSGVGNLKLLPRPSLQIDWASIVPGDERITWDSSGTQVRGSKEFDWVVTPKIAGDLSLPPVRYDFFNPVTRHYELAMTPAIRLTVAAAGNATPTVVKSRDTIGDTPFPAIAGFARSNALTIAIGATVILLIALGAFLIGRRGRREDSDDE